MTGQSPSVARDCIIGGEALTPDQCADEHVIPNALGGRLTTRNATCKACNSRAGHSIDDALIKPFAALAAMYDVPRDRKKHPRLSLPDKRTGKLYELRNTVGKPPFALAPNIQVTKDADGKRNISFHAETKEEAERIYNKLVGSERANVEHSDLNSTVHEGEAYELTMPTISASDTDMLRGIAKTAVVYARHVGIPVSRYAIAVQFLQGKTTPLVPVCVPRTDAVTVSGCEEQPLLHAVSLFQEPGSRDLFAYVQLFHAFDFIVLVDEDANPPSGNALPRYTIDLTFGIPMPYSHQWLVDAATMRGWLRAETEGVGEHWGARFGPLEYWQKHRGVLFAKRAAGPGLGQLLSAIERGESPEQVDERAHAAAARVGNKYGFKTIDLKLSVEQITGKPPEKR